MNEPDKKAAISAIRRELDKYDGIIKATHRQLYKLKEDYASVTCPFKIGDVVTCYGYAHTGKKLRITDIWCQDFAYDWEWKVRGLILLKDGTPGSNKGEFSQRQYSNSIGKS